MVQVVMPGRASVTVLSRPPGPRGEEGPSGDEGWTPVLAIEPDGARRVQRVVDWTGGEGEKPSVGKYVGPGGLVADIAFATDIRGGPGEQGDRGPKGDPGTVENLTATQVTDALGFTPTVVSSTSPVMLGASAAAGTASDASRQDHVHQFPLSVVSQTLSGAGNLAPTDHGRVVEWNAANAALTLPNSLQAGFNCLVRVIHATGLPIFTAASGATIRQADGLTKARKQWSEVSVTVRSNVGGAAAEYVLSGDLS